MRMLSRLVLSMVLVVYLISCSSQVTEWVPTDDLVSAEDPVDLKVVGVILASGDGVKFDEPADFDRQMIHAKVSGKPYSVALDDVSSVMLQRTDYNAGGIVLAVVVVGIIVAIIIAEATDDPEPAPSSSASSCPFVYSFDGEVWRLDAEPFGGAITAGLERHDWTPLENLRAVDDQYRVMLRNEQPETQYVNLAELWVVDHEPGLEVFPGPDGELFPVRDAMAPIAAVRGGETDVLDWLVERDMRYLASAPVAGPDGEVRDEITLTFPRPDNADEARLVADVATSGWAAEMLRYSLEARGQTLTGWHQVVDESPVARELIAEWSRKNDLFDLNVEVEVDGEWVPRGFLRGGGPIVHETRTIQLDLAGVEGDEVRLRVRPPVGFWRLNSFALDYEMLPPLEPTVIAAGGSVPDPGVRANVAAVDDTWEVMPSIGDWTELRFAAPAEVPGMERTALLHGSGYYRIHIDATGEPDLEAVDRITNEIDGLARIGVERWAERQLAATGSDR